MGTSVNRSVSLGMSVASALVKTGTLFYIFLWGHVKRMIKKGRAATLFWGLSQSFSLLESSLEGIKRNHIHFGDDCIHANYSS